MQKVLFCVDSYFQLIGSIGLRLKKYKDWEADIVIYNTTPSARKIYRRLGKEKVFRKVFFADTLLARVGDNYSRAEKFPKYFIYLSAMLKPERGCADILGCSLNDRYDQLLFNGYGAIVECIFNVCYRKNSAIRCYRIDDGLGTYLAEWSAEKWKSRKILEKIMHILSGFQHIEKFVDGYYVAEPDMMAYQPCYPVLKMPELNREDREFVSVLNHVFHYRPEQIFKQKKVVFFGTWGNGVSQDIEVLRVLKEAAAPEEILIKIHPRENKEKYAGLGIDIMERSEIPWETVMLNKDFSQTVFVTLQSSAVFTSRIYFRKTGLDVYAYDCVQGKNYQAPGTIREWSGLYRKIYSSSCVSVPHTLEELKETVRSYI